MRAWVLLVLLSACRSEGAPAAPPTPRAERPPPPPPRPREPEPSASAPPPPVQTDWCTAGLEPLDEETCFVLPTLARDKPRRLLVYLHGIVPPVPESPQKENVMRSVRSASTRAGAAALVPRGIRGIGPSGARDYWAWPTSPAKHRELARGIVARIAAAKEKLERRAGAPFARTYLAGSSNGAYFATNLVLAGEIDVDALGAMSGGARAPLTRREPLPVYIGFGSQDPTTRGSAKRLAAALRSAGYPVELAEHPFGHGAREIYVDEAFAFWDAALAP